MGWGNRAAHECVESDERGNGGSSSCGSFELLGFDFLLDEHLTTWLIEERRPLARYSVDIDFFSYVCATLPI
jgi:hypothetical protein